MNSKGEPTETSAGRGRPRPVSRWVVAAPSITLVLGMLLGGSLVWLTTNNGDGPEAGDEPTDTTDSPPEPGTAVVVPDACLEAAESVREATELIRDGVDDVRAFRAEAIIDMLNDLEDLDAQARAQAETCAEVEVTDAPLTSPLTSPPTSEPTSEPTSDPTSS